MILFTTGLVGGICEIYSPSLELKIVMFHLLEQVASKQYDTKSLTNNQVKFQSATITAYKTITKALSAKHTEFHTYKPKEDRSYRVVLKNMYYYIPTDDIKCEIEKLGHQVANIWNITQHRTKLPFSMFFVDLKPAPTTKTSSRWNTYNNAESHSNPPNQNAP
jgi:hypothetical protein